MRRSRTESDAVRAAALSKSCSTRDAGGAADPDETLFEGKRVSVGLFRCPVDHPNFRNSGPIQRHIVVFPRTSVWIRHQGGRPFPADSALCTIYNRGQVYRREPISREGDRCDWFGVDGDLAREIAADTEPASRDRPERPFGRAFAAVAPELFLAQRLLIRRLRAGDPVDELEMEESVISIVRRALGDRPRPAEGARRRALDLADRARALLATTFREPLSLGDLAARLGTSPFHLCRRFREGTGRSLHQHRLQLRLGAALEGLGRRGVDLAELALDLGFSSHAHFTATFARAYGRPPSAVRADLAHLPYPATGRRRPELRGTARRSWGG